MPTWLTALLDPVNGIVSTIASFIPNPEEKAKAQLAIQAKLVEAYVSADADQRAINKVEASNPSMFVAGGRPAAIWLCVFVLAWQWLVSPIMTWLLTVCGASHIPPLPVLDQNEASILLNALLGLSAIRTVDKIVPGGVTKAITGIFTKKK
ncbi:MAG: hypothetical protein KGJ13_06325 [Patescibacteria group bacterium]|nr:hypothetical protein [Patescibacteria group bacterium]